MPLPERPLPFAALALALLLAGCGPSQREARHALADADVPFSEAEFAQRAGAGDRDTLQLFFDAGMALNAAPEEREAFPLVEAAGGGHAEVVDMLLERGANPHAEGENGRTALVASITQNDHDTTITDQERADVVRALLDAGADPEQTYERNYPGSPLSTVLAAAVREGRAETAQLLLRAGADPRRGRNKEMLTEADSSMFDLLRESGVSVENSAGLYKAACLGRSDLVKRILEAGVDPEEATRKFSHGYNTALVCAIENSHMGAAKKLLDAGADANRETGYLHDNTPLMAAAKVGRTDMVKTLLQAGADPNKGGGEYTKAVMSAVRGGHEEMLKMLLQAGADVNPYDGYGSRLRLLATAKDSSYTTIAAMLREAGAQE